jgi:hypothetical protein
VPERDPEDPLEDEIHSTVLEDEEGKPYIVDQENAGPEAELGGGEWPDPDEPPRSPAPGSA